MPVPSLVTDLSTTVASNSPAGSDNVFPDLDNYLRAMSAFIASIRDNSGNGWVSPYLPLAGGTVTGATTFSNTVTGTKFIPTGTSATGNGMYLPATNTLGFSTNGAEVARLDSSGNLGIGTSSPGAKLDVNGNAAIRLPSIGGSVDLQFPYFGATNAKTIIRATGTSDWRQTLKIQMNTAQLDSAPVDVLTLDASGNLGIGTSSPSQRLAVINNTTYQARAATATGNYTSGGMVFGGFGADASDPNFYGAVGYDHSTGKTYLRNKEFNAVGGIVFETATTGGFSERARITSGGDLLVGTTTATSSNANAITLEKPGGTSGAFFRVMHDNNAVNGSSYSVFYYNNTGIGSITQSGTTAVLYNTTSDQRLKTNIVDAPDAAALIDSIQVRSFDWIADGSHQRYGMVAQELAAVAPEAVHTPLDPDEMMAVDYSKLVPMLIKEIQSLRARVAALEAA